MFGTIGQCSGGKGKCDILDLDSLCKQLAILLSGIDLSLLSLSGKCYPLRKFAPAPDGEPGVC